MKFHVTIFLLYLLGIYSCQNDKLSVEQMHKDIDYYFTTLKEVHPHPYFKYTEKQIDSVHAEIKKLCNEPMNLSKFKYTISRVNKYADGHSNFPLNYIDSVLETTSWIDFSDRQMKIGNYNIQEINGVSASEIASMMEEMVSWELSPDIRQSWKNYYLPHMLLGYFDFELPYKSKVVDSVTGEILDDYILGKSQEKVKQRNYDSIYHSMFFRQQFFEKESIAVFYYNTSHIYRDDKESAENIIKQLNDTTSAFFKKVNKEHIKDVFIDVSQNTGGSDYAHTYVNRYLNYEPYDYKYIFYVTPQGAKLYSEQTKNEEELENSRQSMLDIADKGKKEAEVIISGNKGFKGSVYVIMGSRTLSAAYDFCEGIKRSKAGILVGEMSGQHSPYAGNTMTLALPNSGIKFRCATKFVEPHPPVTGDDGFLHPDIPYKLDHPLNIDDYKKIIELRKDIK